MIKHNQAHQQAALWAADCAQHVLRFFEKENPNDDRPRKAIQAARDWACGKIKVGPARTAALAAHAAAREVKDSRAIAAARAAGNAAAAAHMKGHALAAAMYAAKAAVNSEREQTWQQGQLIKTTMQKQISPQTVSDYLKTMPPKHRALLKTLRATIKSVIPTATEKISWGMPIFMYQERQLVGYAGFKEHCSLFVMSPRVRTMFAKELKPFSTSKGTIRFTVEKPLPVSLVKKMVKARILECASR